MNSYTRLVRPVLFHADPEWTHDRSIRFAELAGSVPSVRRAVAARYVRPDPRLAVEVAGLRFTSPLGLAAGYDKSGRAYPLLSALGFSHVEIGSVSAQPSAGNPKPRLFRLPDEQAIVVAYGVPNDGAEEVAARLDRRPPTVPLGVNVVNTNRGPGAPPEPDDAVIDDYVRTVTVLGARADYLCLNLSCPNTLHGTGFFADEGRLRALLAALEDVRVPLLLKVAPFADIAAMERFLTAVGDTPFVSGFAVNLPPGKPPALGIPPERVIGMPGAVSGKPVEQLVNDTIRQLYQRIDSERHVLVGAGGVFTAADAYRKIRLGASLVQLYTALVYSGPGVVRTINRDLPALLARDGFASVAEAVGTLSRPGAR